MNKEVEASYSNRIHLLSTRLKKLEQQIRVLSWSRVVLFLAIAYMVYASVNYTTPLLFMLTLYASVGIFLALIAFHQRLYERARFLRGELTLNKFEIGEEKKLFNDGSQLAHHSSLANDLDILGEDSFFEKINRCITRHGNELLANMLLHQEQSADKIIKSQASIRELTSMVELRQSITATLHVNKNYISEVKTLPADHNPGTLSSIIGPLLWIWPVLSIGIVTYAFVSGVSALFVVPLIAWPITMVHLKQVDESFKILNKTYGAWDAYAKAFKTWNEHTFTTEHLLSIQSLCTEAVHALSSLQRLSYFWSQRANALAYFVANTFFLFDLLCLSRYHRWHRDYADKLSNWVKTVGEMESYSSLATFSYNNPTYTYPTLNQDQRIVFDEMGHPLLDEYAVRNSIALGEDANTYIVTGSNMAGKSTFLRGIGLNIILAHAGAPVFANSMSFQPCKLLTSFRQADSIQSGMSYFMAELSQLKNIIESLGKNGFSVILLDEILRGTNSEDKSHGSEALLKKLMDRNAISLLATHDLRLGEMEQEFPSRVANYCFESQIVDGELKFDYKIQRGVARNKNASFLMGKLGII